MPIPPKWMNNELAQAYGIDVDDLPEGEPLFGGLQHEVWKIPFGTDYLVLKKQLSQPSDIALALEEAAVQEDVDCAKLIHTSNGKQMLQIEGRYYVRAYRYIDGAILGREPVTPDMAFRLGSILAGLHIASQKCLGIKLQRYSKEPIANYYEINELGKDILGRIRKFTTDFDISQHQAIIGHRDISGKNIIIQSETDRPFLIDFDETGLTTVEGELLDAAFNLGGVHTEAGAAKDSIQSFVAGYKDRWPHDLHFDELSFHTLIGLSEYWWLGVCLNRLRDGRVSQDKLEEREVDRLLKQIPRDINSIDEWLTWLR
jgi:hypothetical protein